MPEPTAARAAENLLHFQSLADRDRANIERLEERMGADAVIEVPLLEHDVHDLEGLAAMSRHLFASGVSRNRYLRCRAEAFILTAPAPDYWSFMCART